MTENRLPKSLCLSFRFLSYFRNFSLIYLIHIQESRT